MRTITNTFNVYNFNELTQEGKKQAIEKWYADESREVENEQFQEFAEEFISLLGFECVKISYSLRYCQGDGFSFTSNTLYQDDILKFINMFITKESNEKGYKLLENTIEKLSSNFEIEESDMQLIKDFDLRIELNRSHSRYAHANTVDIEGFYEEETQEEESITESQEKRLNLIIDNFRKMYLEICNILENEGYSQIYYEMNEAEFSEMCNANDYEFLEDGQLY